MNVPLRKMNPQLFNLRDCYSVLKVIALGIWTYMSICGFTDVIKLNKEINLAIYLKFP